MSAEISRADILGWDVRTWSPAVDRWSAAIAGRPAPLRCLEVGAGPGGPSAWLALQGHDVVCSNLTDAEASARPLHERLGVAARVEYREIDLSRTIPYRDEFDVVVFKSVLGGLGDLATARRAMDEIRAALRPGGVLLWAENIRGSWLHRAARALRGRTGAWRYPTLGELRELLDGFSAVDVHVGGVLAVLGPTERLRAGLAAVDRAAVDRVTPAGWHYMAYGTATR